MEDSAQDGSTWIVSATLRSSAAALAAARTMSRIPVGGRPVGDSPFGTAMEGLHPRTALDKSILGVPDDPLDMLRTSTFGAQMDENLPDNVPNVLDKRLASSVDRGSRPSAVAIPHLRRRLERLERSLRMHPYFAP